MERVSDGDIVLLSDTVADGVTEAVVVIDDDKDIEPDAEIVADGEDDGNCD